MNKTAKRICATFMTCVAALTLTACSGNNSDAGAEPAKDGRPSLEEVKEGYTKAIFEKYDPAELDYLNEYLGEGVLAEFYGCIVDEVYEFSSDKTLRAMANGDTSLQMSQGESIGFDQARNKCTKEHLKPKS